MGVFVEGCKIVVYSYIGIELIWLIYWDGVLGCVKMDLDCVVIVLNEKLVVKGGIVNVVVLKLVVI